MIGQLAVLAVAATALATLAAAGARFGWLPELFAHFPVHYLAMLSLAGVACLLAGRWGWALLALAAAVPNLLAISPYLLALHRGAGPATANPPIAQGPVRLVASNLQYGRDAPAAALAYFRREPADLLLLAEFTPRWHEQLRDLERIYPHVAVRPRWSPWGIAVYSKYPLAAIEDLDLGDDSSSHVRVVVQLPAGPVEVYAVHLASPSTPRRAARRNTQLERLAARIAAADPGLPRIVAGDLNVTPFSPYFADLLRDARLSDARRPFGLHTTWPAWPVPLWIPIDHCLVSGPLTVTRVAAGPSIGSDHLPLECTFTVSP